MGVRDAIAYARFAAGLPELLRRRISLADAERIVRERLARRSESFLEIARRAFYGRSGPYRTLLELAGCEYVDLERAVRDHGLEGALERLRAEGVYVTFEEFKGRTPIVRQGREIQAGPHTFDNPFTHAHIHRYTGGSTGMAARVLIDLDRIWDEHPMKKLADAAHGLSELPTLRWSAGFPSLGPAGMIASILEGNVALRWFRPFTPAELRYGPRERLAWAYIFWAARRAGTPLPAPEHVPIDRADLIAVAVREMLDARGACLLRGKLSMLVKVATAAREAGIDLTGAIFRGGAEPPTPGKVGAIRACGARHVGGYAFAESGGAGTFCTRPIDENDVHLYEHSLALIQHPHELPEFGVTVNAFHFTSLLPTNPKLLLNVQSDDFGTIEERDCGCPLQELGLRRHLRHIRSFRKLTSDGMTLIGTDMARILEEVLPARFGGGPLDYQIVEEERDGRTRLALHVHPRLVIADETAVHEAVLTALAEKGGAATLASATWRQAQSFEIRREPPRFSSGGKFSPLWSLGLQGRGLRAPDATAN
jgi:hypothetical protein